jgi:hypothetical protein
MVVKYSTTPITNTIKVNNLVFGSEDIGYGPTSTTGFWNGIDPPVGGYTIYYYTSGMTQPSIIVANNDIDTIYWAKAFGGTNINTIGDALTYLTSSSNIGVFNANYPSVSTSGLTMNLDAGIVSSYPKTGSTWKDLSGNVNNISGSISTGVTFNTNYFDFSKDIGGAITLNQTLRFGNGNWTLLIWATYETLTTGMGTLLSNNSGGPVGNAFGFGDGAQKIQYDHYNGVTGTGWYRHYGDSILSANTITQLTWVNTSDNKMVMYINDNTDCASFDSYVPSGGPVNSIGRNWYYTHTGKIYLLSYYNRNLSSSEITQTYNAMKSRFGL